MYDDYDSGMKYIVIPVIIIGCLLGWFLIWNSKQPPVDVYCNSAWDAICIKVPKGQKLQTTSNGCITDGKSVICGSYSKN